MFMKDELMPCPFPHPVKFIKKDVPSVHEISRLGTPRFQVSCYCPECPLHWMNSKALYETKEKAISAWNTRADERNSGVQDRGYDKEAWDLCRDEIWDSTYVPLYKCLTAVIIYEKAKKQKDNLPTQPQDDMEPILERAIATFDQNLKTSVGEQANREVVDE